MTKTLAQLRPVYVVGIGMHPYQRLSSSSYVELGLRAVREALADAGIAWSAVEAAYNATELIGMAPTRVMLRHLGATGIPMMQIANASASGSSAFRVAALDVAGGTSDLVLAMGVDKPAPVSLGSRKAGLDFLERERVAAFTHFGLLAQKYVDAFGATPEDIAQVAVKNSRNGALNPYAHRRQALTIEQVMAGPPVAGFFTPPQCTPVGEGAAATLLASEDGIRRLGIDPRRAIRVAGSVLRSEEVYDDQTSADALITAASVAQIFAETGLRPDDLDIVELHDAFTVEEIFYTEVMGLCDRGEAPSCIRRGEFNIGGRVAVSASGGLLALGHPIGPTGVGQVVETVRQLRGEAEGRQHPGARVGLVHMVGVGAVCAVHILDREI